MRRMLVVVVLAATAAACEPEPGETRCSAIPVYGTTIVNCKTGHEDPPPGWWCSTRAADSFGVCARSPGKCEAWRREQSGFGPCAFSSLAIYALVGEGPIGCYTSAAACADVERAAGRDGSRCTAAR
jgi:hypothetical protein